MSLPKGAKRCPKKAFGPHIKGSFKGDLGIDIDIDVEVDVDT